MVKKLLKIVMICGVFGGAQQASAAQEKKLTREQEKALIDLIVKRVVAGKMGVNIIGKGKKNNPSQTRCIEGIDPKVLEGIVFSTKTQMSPLESPQQLLEKKRSIHVLTFNDTSQASRTSYLVDEIPTHLEESAQKAVQDALEQLAQGKSAGQVGVALEDAAHTEITFIVATLLSAGLAALGVPISPALIQPLATVAIKGIYKAGSLVVETIEHSNCCISQKSDEKAVLVAKNELAELQEDSVPGITRSQLGEREFNPIARYQVGALATLTQARK